MKKKIKKKKIYTETWKGSNGDSEIQHFLGDNTYVFGFNKKLLGIKTYNKVIRIIHEALKINKKSS